MLKMFTWTFLMILGFTGSIIARVYTQTEITAIPLYWAWLGVLGGILLAYFSIQQIINLNATWRESLRKTILDLETEIIAHWQYNTAEWNEFSKRELNRKHKRMMLGVWAFVMMLIIATVLVAWYQESREAKTIYIMMETFMVMGGITSFFGWKYQRKMYQIYLKSNHPEVHFSPRGALINREWIIPFQRVNAYLSEVTTSNKYNQECLKVSIYQIGYETNVTTEHFIPIPQSQKNQVKEVIDQLRKSSAVHPKNFIINK